MSNFRNRVQLIGHLGAAPEIKVFENTKLARMRLATNESYKSANGEWKEATTWHTITAWGPLADRAEKQLTKGSYVLVEGKLVNREYETSQNEKRYVTEVRLSSFMSLEKKGDKASDQTEETIDADITEDSDDLPF